MIYRILIIFFVVVLFSCSPENKKIDLVVYPEYCGGCVSRNFYAIKSDDLEDKFNVYFDTSDTFILDAANINSLNFYHIDNSEIRKKFGDYANIVVFSTATKPIELKTNETIEKGKHY